MNLYKRRSGKTQMEAENGQENKEGKIEIKI
jgi:hypothetical protein